MELSSFDFDIWLTALDQFRIFLAACDPLDVPELAEHMKLSLEYSISARKKLRSRRSGQLELSANEIRASHEAVTMFLEDMEESLDALPLTHPDRDALFASVKSCNKLLRFLRNWLRSESLEI